VKKIGNPVQPSKALLMMGGVFALVGLLMVCGMWGAYLTDSNIERNGARAEGMLDHKRVLRSSDGDTDYVLEYRFTTASGEAMKAQRTVDKAVWRGVREGEPLEVRYSVTNPKRNFPAGGGVNSLPLTLTLSAFGGFFVLIGASLIWAFLRPSQPTL
jgi:hypothetical protein